MKKNIKLIIITLILLAIPVKVYAHPGSLAADNCHYCRTNCEKWEVAANERHCHSGGSSSTANNNNNNNNNYTYVPEVKSNNNSIKELKINNQIIAITYNMEFTTTEDSVLIEVLLNDEKASYNLENNNLELGDNLREITVTAENGNMRIYSIKIIREKIEYNTEFELTINNKKIKFINNKAEITIDSEITNLDYKINLEDDRVKLKVEGDTNLKEGTNLVKYIIINPYGEEYIYELTVEKESASPIEGIIWILFIILVIYIGRKTYIKFKNENFLELLKKDLNKLKK